MLVACWSAKGGVGTTVVTTALALIASRTHPLGVLVVDLCGDVPAVLGMAEPDTPGVADWLAAGPEVPADGLARLEVEAPTADVALIARGGGELRCVERAEVLAAVLAREGRAVVVDCGDVSRPGSEAARALAGAAGESLLITRPCYLSLRRASRLVGSSTHEGGSLAPSGVVVVREQGRALEAGNVSDVLGVDVRAEVPFDPAVARAVDAGLLASRLPRSLSRALRGLP